MFVNGDDTYTRPDMVDEIGNAKSTENSYFKDSSKVDFNIAIS